MDEVLQKIVEVLKEEGAEKVYLFGSRAAGNAKPESDYDICMLKKMRENQWTTEGKRIYHILRNTVPDVSTDFLLYTPEGFDEDRKYKGFVAYQINRSGIVIYEAAGRS